MRIFLIIILALSLTSCKIVDVITGIGAGASVAGFLAPPILQARGQVKPKDILAKMDTAYQEYDAQVENIMHNVGLTPKERKALIKEKTKVLNSRVKAYKGLLGNAYGFPKDIIDAFSGPEGQEFIGEIAKILPPPWNELAPTGASLGLLMATIFGYRGRNRFRNMAFLMGNSIQRLKKSGFLDKDKLIEANQVSASDMNISYDTFHTLLKRYKIT